jgi:gas vesicle protein
MSARAKLRLLIVVLLAVVCLGFIAAIGMSAAASAATQEDPGHDGYDGHDDYDGHDYNRTDYERSDRPGDGPEEGDRSTTERSARGMHVHVHATEDGVAVTVKGDSPVDVDIEALEGDYAGEGQYRLDPGETLELPAPESLTMVRVLAESDDARLEVVVGFERYEYDCGPATHEQVAPAEVSYEWEGAGEERRRSQDFERPPVECPEPDDDPGGGGDDPEDRYEDAREEFWDSYEDGNDAAWTAYEALRAAAWGGYEDGRATVWETYEALRNPDGGDDPQDRLNGTVEFAERVGNDTQDDADRLRNDTEDAAERIGNDTQDDADRLREDLENGSDRVREDANDTVRELAPGDGDGDNESDPQPPEDLPPEDFPPEEPPEEPPEDLPPEDLPPGDGDDNDTDDGDRPSVPGPDRATVDADAELERDDDSVRARGSATVEAGGITAHVHERLVAGLDSGS